MSQIKCTRYRTMTPKKKEMKCIIEFVQKREVQALLDSMLLHHQALYSWQATKANVFCSLDV